MTNMESAFFAYNGFTGPLPDFTFSTKLQEFYASFNFLTGTIPSSVTKLGKLHSFRVNRNLLHGTLPPNFGDLTAMVFLAIGGNSFEGTLPSMRRWSGLLYLDTVINKLTGSIPTYFTQMPKLVYVSLGFNNFHGHLLSSYANLTDLIYFNVESNFLSSPLPTFNVALLLLNTRNNFMSGTLPLSYNKLTRMQAFSVETNIMHGTIPESYSNLLSLTYYFNLRQNLFSGDFFNRSFNL